MGAFLEEATSAKVARMGGLFTHVQKVPALIGDPQRFDALRVATEALGKATGRHEAALRARKRAVAALPVAAKEFDGAYGHLVKEIRNTARRS